MSQKVCFKGWTVKILISSKRGSLHPVRAPLLSVAHVWNLFFKNCSVHSLFLFLDKLVPTIVIFVLQASRTWLFVLYLLLKAKLISKIPPIQIYCTTSWTVFKNSKFYGTIVINHQYFWKLSMSSTGRRNLGNTIWFQVHPHFLTNKRLHLKPTTRNYIYSAFNTNWILSRLSLLYGHNRCSWNCIKISGWCAFQNCINLFGLIAEMKQIELIEFYNKCRLW